MSDNVVRGVSALVQKVEGDDDQEPYLSHKSLGHSATIEIRKKNGNEWFWARRLLGMEEEDNDYDSEEEESSSSESQRNSSSSNSTTSSLMT